MIQTKIGAAKPKMKTVERNPVVLTKEDYNALQTLARGASPANEMSLAHELARAIIVTREALPPHTIRISSRVTVKDLDTAREMSFSIVMPGAADMRQNKVSVLTPMGTALIGFRAGEEVEWMVPSGIKQFKILEVVNSPAA